MDRTLYFLGALCRIFVFERRRTDLLRLVGHRNKSVVPSDRIARIVSVGALIDTGILSLSDLFLIEILVLGG